MTAMALAPMASFRAPSLPWANSADDEKRFQRIARRVLTVVLLVAVVVPFLPLPTPQRVEVQPLAAPIARLLLERVATPPPPPKADPADAVKPDATQPEATPDQPAKPREAPVAEARRPDPAKPPGEVALDNARRKASGVGLLAMKDQLAEIVSAPAAVQLRQDIQPGPGVGSGEGAGVGAGQEEGVPLRAMITSNATRGSGGINTAAYSRDAGGGGLAGRGTTLVEGVAGGGGRGGAGGGGGVGGAGSGRAGAGVDGGGAAGKGGTLQKASGGKASRSIEEIKLVFERNKGAIYAIYNRALRDDPALQGKVVLELTIAPGGGVSALRIVSSELKADELERKLLARIRAFDFGSKDVEVMVVTWPVDFLPS